MSRDSGIAKTMSYPLVRRRSYSTLDLRLPSLNARPTVRLETDGYHERVRALDLAAEEAYSASQGHEAPTCNGGDGWPCTADDGEPCAKCRADAEYARLRRMADDAKREPRSGGES